MHAVHWKRQAINDIVRIGSYISLSSPVNADKLITRLQAKIAALATYPNLGHIGRQPGTRELVAPGHYIVIYRVTAVRVEIIRIKHTARAWP
ncbi:MAG: type II toxin-antitoxin system RelE/ParE family toxin [Pseudomonadota bacterium]|nr:type II toxin-antitoxin system RelE/ParE family toxin [Pseudomonadota bacterium]